MNIISSFNIVFINTLALVFSTAFITASKVSYAEDSLEALLKDADNALGHESTPSSEEQNQKTQKPVVKTNKKKTTTPVAPSTPQAEATNESKDDKKIEQAPLAPIDPARVSEILALDIQAKEREKIVHSRGVSARIGYLYDVIPAVYQVAKDDDTFTFSSATSLKGVGIETTASSPITEAFGTGNFRGFANWGLGVGAGILQGNAAINRRGITDEDVTYPYQLYPIDGSLSIGWTSNAGFNLWVAGGYAADIVRQLGKGQTDTFTAVFTGETFSIGAGWKGQWGYEVFTQYRQRGVFGSSDKEPKRSRIAGRMISVGVGVPISG